MVCILRLGCIRGIYITGFIVGCIKDIHFYISFFVLELYLPPSSLLLTVRGKKSLAVFDFTIDRGIFSCYVFSKAPLLMSIMRRKKALMG